MEQVLTIVCKLQSTQEQSSENRGYIEWFRFGLQLYQHYD
jgi:hypothetical protein